MICYYWQKEIDQASLKPYKSVAMKLLKRFLLATSLLKHVNISVANTASVPVDDDRKDPNLQEISFDLGFGEENFEVFMDPDIQTISQGKHDKIVKPHMKGHAVKFFNMSPYSVKLFW